MAEGCHSVDCETAGPLEMDRMANRSAGNIVADTGLGSYKMAHTKNHSYSKLSGASQAGKFWLS